MTDDEDAIRRCQQGDIEGLTALIRRYQADALRLAYLLAGDRYLAEDIVQDSFLQAYRAMPRFDRGRPFQPWFHQIVTNTTRMRLRSAARRREVSIASLPHDDEGGAPLNGALTEVNPATYAERREDRAAIGQALAALTEKQREAVALRYYFAYTDQEIAAILGCRVNTARHRIYDGLRALEQVIRSRFPSLLRESASASAAPWPTPPPPTSTPTASNAAPDWRTLLSHTKEMGSR
ncbi:MAG TPA: RNA polymerase sigma factor [Ktedonobacterales bacterium]|nr:RNA polymerase sigma factor [Ktedonobacterales bacterium]